MSRVEVKDKVLRWALERSDQTVKDLQKKFPRLDEWIAGSADPTLRQIEALAKATLTPLGYFFLSEPPVEKLPIPHFRTIKDKVTHKPSPDLLETVHIMQRRQSWLREYLIEQGQEPLSFVNSVRLGQKVDRVAEKIRATLGFEDDWASKEQSWSDALRILRETMESIGIMVSVSGIVDNNTKRKLDPDEFKGFVLVDDYAPLVFINGVDWKASQMFTLAHELAHLFYGSSAAFDLRSMLPADEPTEKICNQVAAELLVPERELAGFWPRVAKDKNPFQPIARHFKVSAIVGARRALDIGLIDQKQFFQFYNAYQSEEHSAAKRKSPGGNFYATQNLRLGKRFASTVIRAAREGKLLYSDAFRLTSLHGKTFDKYAAILGIESG